MHRAARRMLMTRRGGYGAGSSPGAAMGGGGYDQKQSNGLLTPGNIDLHSRPIVHNPDGSISTVRSISVGIGPGRTALIPTVAADGSGILSNADAIKQYQTTGQHLGIFNSDDAADAYAQTLHENQAQEYLPKAGIAPPVSSAGGGGYNDGPGGSTLDSQGNAFTGGGYDDGDATDPFSAYAARVRQLESGGNPNAITGHNYGLFQFGPEEMRKYGITDWRNQAQQYSGLQQEYAEHSRLLSQSGLPATPANLYLMHQQGVGGAPALLSADPSQPAWQVLRKFYPSDAVARKAISGNIPSNSPLAKADPSGITAGQFVDLWQAKYGGQPYGGGITPQTASNSATAGIPGVPSTANPQTTGLLGSLLGGQSGGANPMMAMAGNLMNQQVEAPKLAPPQPVRPQLNPQALQQQQALLQGILQPRFQSFTG